MTGPVAVLDACALVPIRLATTLLWLAEAGLFQPLWSERILDEVQRNLPDVGIDPKPSAAPHGIEIVHPDRFLLRIYDAHPGLVRATIEREIAAFRHPPETITDFLHTLTPTVPKFAERAAQS